MVTVRPIGAVEGPGAPETVARMEVALEAGDLVTGTDLRCVSTISFTSRTTGASTFVDCAATVISARLNDRDLLGVAR